MDHDFHLSEGQIELCTELVLQQRGIPINFLTMLWVGTEVRQSMQVMAAIIATFDATHPE